MNHIKRIRRIAGVLAGLAGALVAFGTTPAFATLQPPESGGPAGAPLRPAPVQVHTIVAGGMPGWQIALFAAAVAVLLDRARATRRKAITTAA